MSFNEFKFNDKEFDKAFNKAIGKKSKPSAFTTLVVNVFLLGFAALLVWLAWWLIGGAINDYNHEITLKNLTYGQAFIIAAAFDAMILAGKIINLKL